MTDVTDSMTDEEKQELAEFMKGYGSPVPEEKHNIHKFLDYVAKTKDTTKVGFLNDAEIGLPKFPLRTLKFLALFSGKVMENPLFEEFFLDQGEILASTSLSRQGKLVSLAVVQRREMGDVTKLKTPSKSWFGFKKKEAED